MAVVVGTAAARNIDHVGAPVIPVCTDTAVGIGWAEMSQAKGMASRMFAPAGVTIVWKAMDNRCPADALKVSLVNQSAPADHPNSYAYALPYDGTHIILFWDRIKQYPEERGLPYLLAHVLVHEITHILQGFPHHSETGVMKARFATADVGRMERHPLAFTTEDLQLIQRGLQIRRARLAEKGILEPTRAGTMNAGTDAAVARAR